MNTMPLDRFSIDDLDRLIADAQARRKLLCDALVSECQESERALQEANKAKLAKYNIPYGPGATSTIQKPRRKSRAAVYTKGQVYRHPDDAKLTFKAGGSYPAWVRELHDKQRRAVLVPEIVAPTVTQKVG